MAINVNVNDFHPAFRSDIQAEVNRLMFAHPPIKSIVNITLANEVKASRCACGKCKIEKKVIEDAWAVTITNKGMDPHKIEIVFNEMEFGPRVDVAAVKKRMADPILNMNPSIGYVLAHEYGHAMEHMLEVNYSPRNKKNSFTIGNVTIMLLNGDADEVLPLMDDKSIMVAEKMRAFFESLKPSVRELPDEWEDEKVSLEMIYDWMKKAKHPLVSPHAYLTGGETFAECFAALHWGDKKQKLLPSVWAMADVINVVYQPGGSA